MAIHTIDDVKINGKTSVFNGFIYSVGYQAGLANEGSKVNVTIVNESGNFFEPELSLSQPYRIEIGNIVKDNFYAVTRTFKKGSNGRQMEISFVDGSSILDRIYIGLYKRMGDETTNIPGLIIVGREMHPCDANGDGVFDQSDADLLAWRGKDPCELKCPTDTDNREPVIEDCVRREIVEVFDVKYSFQDLLDALQGAVVQFPEARAVSYPVEADLSQGSVDVNLKLPPVLKNPNANPKNRIKIKAVPKDYNKKYFTDYSGTLREVLKNWCADFGWSFFWENDELNFIDTRQRPRIKYPAFNNVESVEDTKTLEGTVARGFVTRYAQQGINSSIQCENARPYLLRCLTLQDLFGEYYKPAWNAVVHQQGDYASPLTGGLALPIPEPSDSSPDNQLEYIDTIYPDGVEIQAFERSCVCAYYSDKLRHLNVLWNYYGIKSPATATAQKFKWLDRLGQMKIISVLSSESVGDDATKYKKLLGHDSSDTGSKTQFSEEEIANIKKYNGYLVVVQRPKQKKGTEDLIDKQFRLEENLSNQFMGQHWYRAYSSPFIGETPSIFPNGQYFGALSTNIGDLPFANFNHTYKSNVSKMTGSFVQRQRNDYRQYGGLRFAVNYSKNVAKKNVKSIIYFNKNVTNQWLPLKNAETPLVDFLKELDNYMFQKRDLTDGGDKLITMLATQDGTPLIKKEFWKDIELYVFYPEMGKDRPADKRGLRFTNDFVNNPNEEDIQHTESLEPFALASAGLLSKRCVRYKINGLPIYTPAGSSVLFQEQYEFKWETRAPVTKDYSRPAYKVYVSSNIINRGVVPKIETLQILPAINSNAMTTEYQVKDISREALPLLNKLTENCELSTDEITRLHQDYASNMNFSVEEPFVSRKYSLYGVTIPSKLSIRDGLESVSVSIDAAGAVTSQISIGNSLFTPPSPDYMLKTLELNRRAAATTL